MDNANPDPYRLIPVLDKGYIKLRDLMPQSTSPDLAVVNAARISFLGESRGEERDKKLLNYLLENRHTSPFEHVIFSFEVKAPILVWRQWMRHRTWSYNEQSGRYVEYEDEEFYIPHIWRAQSKDNKQASEGYINPLVGESLTQILESNYRNAYILYQTALNSGVSREMARLFLPGFALYSTAVCTVDAHNLMHFLRLRLHPHAQYEIREYAIAIASIFAQVMPWTYEAFTKEMENYAS